MKDDFRVPNKRTERLTHRRADGAVCPNIQEEDVFARWGEYVQSTADKLCDYEDAEEQGVRVRLIAPNGCGFCRGVRIMSGNFEGSFPLDEHHNEVIQTDDTTDFHFCPMCGRPLVSREEAEAALARGTDNG